MLITTFTQIVGTFTARKSNEIRKTIRITQKCILEINIMFYKYKASYKTKIFQSTNTFLPKLVKYQ